MTQKIYQSGEVIDGGAQFWTGGVPFTFDGQRITLVPLPEGIYFNMSAAEYHALPYFSRSAAQLVRFSGKEFEHSLKNPVEETAAMALGTAIHSMFLEPKEFEETYVKAPAITYFEGKKYFIDKVKIIDGNGQEKEVERKRLALETVEDLKPYLETFGLKKSGKKEDLINSAREHLNPDKVVIWDDVESGFYPTILDENGKEVFDKTKNKLGQIVLSDKDFSDLENMRETLEQCEDLPQTIENGRAEVVVIWKDRETGIMCKCRLDYVQPLAVTDVKSFSIKDMNTPLLEQLEKKTIWSSYNLQFAIYREALETAINAINVGKAKVYGETDEIWLKEFLKNPVKQFFILYVRTQAPYQMQALELETAEVANGGDNAYFSVAHNIWRQSLGKYAHFLKTGQWLGESEIVTLRDVKVPNVMWQNSIEL